MSVSSHAVFTADSREQEVRLLVDLVRLSRLTLLHAETGADKSRVLQSSVLPLLQRGAGTGQTEVAVLFDTWNEAPLPALIRQIEQAVGVPDVRAPIEIAHHDAGVLSGVLAAWQQRLGVTFFVILDRFEKYLAAPREMPQIRQFEDEFVAAVNDRALRANFLLALDEDAAPLLDRLRQRIPGLGDARVRLPSANARERPTEREPAPTRPLLVGSQAQAAGRPGTSAETQISSDPELLVRAPPLLVGSQSKRDEQTRTESLEQSLERMRAEYNARIVLAPHARVRKHADAASPSAPFGTWAERDTPAQPLITAKDKSTAPEQPAVTARRESTAPEQAAVTARHESTPPEQPAVTARHESTAPEQAAVTARHESTAPEQGAATARHESARPEQPAAAARHQSTAPEQPAEVQRRVVEQPSLQPRRTRAAAIAHKPFPISRRVWVTVSLALIVVSSLLIMRQGRFPERAPDATQSASSPVATPQRSGASTDNVAAQSTLPALPGDDTPLRSEQEYFASEDWLGPGNGTAGTPPATAGTATSPPRASVTPPSVAQADPQVATRGAASSSPQPAAHAPSGPMLYIHVRSEAQRARAERMIRPLARRGIRVTGIKVVKFGPPVPDLRYFRSTERDEAVKVALALRDVGYPAQRLNHMRGFEGRATQRQYELWLPPASRRSAR